MGDGVPSCAPVTCFPPPVRANQACYSEASSSADSSASEFDKIIQEVKTTCSTDPTTPTPREEALQQSLPENERHLPPSFLVQGGGTRTSTVGPACVNSLGHQTGGIYTPHSSETAKGAIQSLGR
jgi:hypothetical protein